MQIAIFKKIFSLIVFAAVQTANNLVLDDVSEVLYVAGLLRRYPVV